MHRQKFRSDHSGFGKAMNGLAFRHLTGLTAAKKSDRSRRGADAPYY